MGRAFGIDISRYQSSKDGSKKMDFDAVRAHSEEVTFIAARTGISWGYNDPMFRYYWDEMARIQVMRIAYHVLYFGESALAQMDSLFRMLDGKTNFAHDRIALDVEVAGINTRSRITATTQKCLDICRTRTGFYPMLYSRAEWVNTNLSVRDLPTLDWWLATYRRPLVSPLYTQEHNGPPYLPKGVSSYLIHQTGDRCKSIGGVSYYMDYNRWNGGKADVLRYFGNPGGVVLPPENNVLFKAKCIVTALYKRNGPGPGFKVVGSLKLGDIVSVYEIRDGWFRVDPNAQLWCSGKGTYLQRLSDPPEAGPALFKAQCIVKALFKREGPSRSNKIIGNLIRDDIVSVYEVKDNWFRIEPTQNVWCSGASQYMRRL